MFSVFVFVKQYFAEVIINDDVVRPQDEVTCEAGDCLQMKIIVTNSLDKNLTKVTLSVQFYQDYQNGTLNYRMETRLAITGSNKLVFYLF